MWWLVLLIIIAWDDVRLMGLMCVAGCGMRSYIGLPWWWFGIDVEPPHSGSHLFPESMENECPGFAKYFHVKCCEDNCASCVAKFAHAEKVVGELTHNVAVLGSRW